MKIVYSFLEKGFLKYLLEKQKKNIGFNELKYEFVDKNGYKYYSFTKETLLPISRLAKLQEYVMWLQKGVDIEEYETMLNLMDKTLTDGLLAKKNASKIGFIISELKDRKNMVVHEELFYNFIAVQLIRDDESIIDFNNKKQLEKVEAIREMNKSTDGFFLIIQKFLKVLSLSDITKEELDKLLEEAIVRSEASKRILISLSEKQ